MVQPLLELSDLSIILIFPLVIYMRLLCALAWLTWQHYSSQTLLRQAKPPLNYNLVWFSAGRETSFWFSGISTAEASKFTIHCPELTFTNAVLLQL